MDLKSDKELHTDHQAVLGAFSNTLAREAHILARDPVMLWQQLYNRLQWEREPVRRILQPELEQRSMPGSAPWLKLRTRPQESKALMRTLEGHTSDGIALAFSPDGEILASSSEDKTTRLWDVKSGSERAVLTWHIQVSSLIFSPDGKKLLTKSAENSYKLWNTITGSPIDTSPGRLLALAPDWNVIATAGAENNVRLWQPQTGAEIALLPEPQFMAKKWVFSPDGSILLSYDKKMGVIQLWEVHSGALRATFRAHAHSSFSDVIRTCVFSPDGRRFVSAGSDYTIRCWDVETGEQISVMQGHKRSIGTCAFSPDGKTLVSGSDDATVRLWDLDSGRQIRLFAGHQAKVISCTISPDGNILISTDTSHPQGWGDVVTKIRELSSGRLLSSIKGRGPLFFTDRISPDGNLLIKIFGSFKLFDLHSGAELPRLEGHTAEVLAFAISPDGHTAASTGRDKMVLLWDLRHAGQTESQQGHQSEVTSCAFSEDGAALITAGGWDKTVRLWDVAAAREKAILKHGSKVNRAAIAPDGKVLAAATQDKTIRLWDIHTENELAVLEGHTGGVYDCAFSSDGKTLASVGDELTIRIWNYQTRSQVTAFAGHDGVITSCTFSPDGSRLVTGSVDQTIKLWNISGPARDPQIFRYKGSLEHVAVSPDGNYLAAMTGSRDLHLSSIITGEPVMNYAGHTSYVTSCAFNRNNSLLLTTSRDKTLRLWLVETGRNINTFHCLGESTCCAFSPDGKTIAAGDAGGNIYLLELIGFKAEAASLREQFHREITITPQETSFALSAWTKRPSIKSGHEADIRACAISTDGRLIVTGSGDSTIKVWDVNQGSELATLRGHSGTVYGCALSSDAKYIASGASDNTLRIWDTARQIQEFTFKGHEAEIEDCAFSPDDRWLVSASGDMTLKIWDVSSRREVASLTGHVNTVYACVVSPDGNWIVSASSDKTLKVWNASKRKLRSTLNGHSGYVKDCDISPDGRWIVSASEDKTLKVWDAEKGNELATLTGHSRYGTICAFSPDGRWIVSTNGDKTLRIWHTRSWQEERSLALPGLAMDLVLHPFKPFAFCAIRESNLHLFELEGIAYGPIIRTAVEDDEGLAVNCPACQQRLSIDKKLLGTEITCTNQDCALKLKINTFTLESSSVKKSWKLW